jgi:hypothetical protein
MQKQINANRLMHIPNMRRRAMLFTKACVARTAVLAD